MKKLHTLFLSLVFIIVLLMPTQVNAETTDTLSPSTPYSPAGFYLNYNKLKPGVRNKYYTIENGTSDYWIRLVNDSFNYWYQTNTPIAFYNTTNFSQSIIDTKTKWVPTDSAWGWTSMWVIANGPDLNPNPHASSWDYANVTINNSKLQNTTYTFDRTVILHELGHAFGLDHINEPYDLMYPSSEGHLTSVPSSNDINKINVLHK